LDCEKTELSGITDRSHKATVTSRPVTSLSHQEGRIIFWGRHKFYIERMYEKMVMHTICPRHFFRGGKRFSRGAKPSP